jgi:hypothetical protein
LRTAPVWRGSVAALMALGMILGIDPRPAAAEDGAPEYSRTPVLVHNASCPIGFTEDTVADAFTGMDKGGGHAVRHLVTDGLIPNKGSVASQVKYFQDNFGHVLTSPEKTFDWKIGGTQAKGFAKKVNGKVVVIFVAKEGNYQGKMPGAKNMTKWGLW